MHLLRQWSPMFSAIWLSHAKASRQICAVSDACSCVSNGLVGR